MTQSHVLLSYPHPIFSFPNCTLLNEWPKMSSRREKGASVFWKLPNLCLTIYITCEGSTRKRGNRIKPVEDGNSGQHGHNFTKYSKAKERKKNQWSSLPTTKKKKCKTNKNSPKNMWKNSYCLSQYVLGPFLSLPDLDSSGGSHFLCCW